MPLHVHECILAETTANEKHSEKNALNQFLILQMIEEHTCVPMHAVESCGDFTSDFIKLFVKSKIDSPSQFYHML